jgi:hypothetical protein
MPGQSHRGQQGVSLLLLERQASSDQSPGLRSRTASLLTDCYVERLVSASGNAGNHASLTHPRMRQETGRMWPACGGCGHRRLRGLGRGAVGGLPCIHGPGRWAGCYESSTRSRPVECDNAEITDMCWQFNGTARRATAQQSIAPLDTLWWLC